MTSLVSIIIPVRNSEKWLRRCLDSILEQDYSAWEGIIVDDGSDDSSPSICDAYATKDSRFRVFHQNKCGVSSARNKALTKAAGEYICFVDSDDAVAPNYISALIRGLGDEDLSVGGFVRYLSDGRCITFKPAQCSSFSFLSPQTTVFRDNLGLLNGPCSILFKSDIIKHHCISFPKDLSFGEDTMFIYQYLNHCRSISFISSALYYYFTNDGDSLSSNYREERLDERRLVWRTRRDFVKRKHLDDEDVMNELYKDLWSIAYDGVFSVPTPTLAGFRRHLFQPEIKELRGKMSLFNAPIWIKLGISHQEVLLLFVIRIITSKRCRHH